MMFVDGLIPRYGGSFNKLSFIVGLFKSLPPAWCEMLFLSSLKFEFETFPVDFPVKGLSVI